jgi:hypothetical protein
MTLGSLSVPRRERRSVHTVSNSSDNTTDEELGAGHVSLERSDLDEDSKEHDVGSDLSHPASSKLVSVPQGKNGSRETVSKVRSVAVWYSSRSVRTIRPRRWQRM